MPRVPGPEEYGNVRAQRDPGVSGATPAAFGAGSAIALEGFGRTVQNVGQHLREQERVLRERRQRAEDAAFRTALQGRLEVEGTKLFASQQNQAVEGAESFTDSLRKSWKTTAEDTLRDVRTNGGFRPSDEAIRLAKSDITALGHDYESKAIIYENNARVAKFAATLDETINGIATQAMTMPGTRDDLDAALARAGGAIEALGDVLPPGTLSAKRSAATAAISEAWANGLIRQDPERAARVLSGTSRLNRVIGDFGALEASVLQQESGGKVNAVGPWVIVGGKRTRAYGPMQVLPDTARQIAPALGDDLSGMSDDEIGAFLRRGENGQRYGSYYLRQQWNRFRSPVLAAAAYFAGPGAVEGWLDEFGEPGTDPNEWLEAVGADNPKTEKYVRSVVGRLPAATPEDPGATDGALSSLPVDRRRILLDRADAEIRARDRAARSEEATERQRFLDRWKDHVASVEATGEGIENFRASDFADVLKPGELAELQRQEDLAFALHDDLQTVMFGTPEELNEVVSRYQPTPGSETFAEEQEIYNEVVKAAQKRQKSLGDDPAAYVGQLPEVRAAFERASEAPQDARALQVAVAASLEAQTHLGLPEWSQRALSQGQAGALVAQATGAAPEDAADILEGMARQYGKHWPKVYRDLVADGLPPSMAVLATLDRPSQAAARVAYVEALRAGKDDLKAAIGSEAVTEIEDELRLDLADFRDSLRFAPNGSEIYGHWQEAAMLVAMRWARHGQPKLAARKAAEALVNNVYAFTAEGYRVPVEYDAGTVSVRAEYAMLRLKPEDLDPRGTMVPGVPTENMLQSALDSARRGQWVTNEDETGLLRLNEHQQPVVLADGTFLRLPFEAPPDEPPVDVGRDAAGNIIPLSPRDPEAETPEERRQRVREFRERALPY